MPLIASHDRFRAAVATASVRTSVTVSLAFADGYETVARVCTFSGLTDGKEHLLLALGDWQHTAAPLVRLHSECLTGDVFGSQRCDRGPQLREAVEEIADAGGFLLYLRQEGRGIGLYEKLEAYALQDQGLDTYEANEALGHPADARDYTAAAQMLTTLGHTTVELLSNDPDKSDQLEALGITVADRRPTGVFARDANRRYLETKIFSTGHTIDLPTPLLAA
ncbi:MAG TPA: GTP cyclohydrolase II [Solirubrobacteraceae bacterium]|nr:GTP cyclohydrolase II [Solirubrobacteraceae bacterium]